MKKISLLFLLLLININCASALSPTSNLTDQKVVTIAEISGSSFQSVLARDTFFGINSNLVRLKTGIPIDVNEGTSVTTFVWLGDDNPTSYDPDLFVEQALNSGPGTLYLGVDGASLSSAGKAVNFTSAYGDNALSLETFFDENGSRKPFEYKFEKRQTFTTAGVFDTVLNPPFDFLFVPLITAYTKIIHVRPASDGVLTLKGFAGPDANSPIIEDTRITISVSDIGNIVPIELEGLLNNPGDDQFLTLEGVDLFGGLQTDGLFTGQIKPFLQATFHIAEPIHLLNQDDLDQYVLLNHDYRTPTNKDAGIIANTFPTTTTTTITDGLFIAGIAGVSNPTLITDGSDIFVSGDFILVNHGNDVLDNDLNDGPFEVLSHVGTLLTIKGVGLTPTTEDFVRDQFIFQQTTGFVTKSHFSILRITDSNIEVGFGSSSPITFLPLGEEGNGIYDGSGTIPTSTVATITDTFTLNGGNIGIGAVPDITAILGIESTTRGFLMPRMTTTQRDAIVTPATGLEIYNLTTSEPEFYNGLVWVDIASIAINAGGATSEIQYNNAGSLGGIPTITTNGLTNLNFADNVTLSFGTGDDLFIFSEGTNTAIVNAKLEFTLQQSAAADLNIRSAAIASDIVVALGTDTNTTHFRVEDVNAIDLLRVDGNGEVILGEISAVTNPDSLLHLHAGSAGSVAAGGESILTLENNGNVAMQFLTPDVNHQHIIFGRPANAFHGSIFYNQTGTPDGFRFETGGDVFAVAIDQNQALAVGTWQADGSAALEIKDTARGFLPPRMTTVQRNAISSPATGLEIFNTTLNEPEFYNGTSWGLTEGQNIYTSDGTVVGGIRRYIGESNNTLMFTQYNSDEATFTTGTEKSIGSNALEYSAFLGDGTGAKTSIAEIHIAATGANTGLVFINTVNDKGAVYFDDYSAGFVNRSLVDKEYVDTHSSFGTAGGDDTQIQYNSSGVLAGIPGITTNGTHLSFADNTIAGFGNTDALSIYHTGTLGVLDNTTGDLKISNFGTAGDIVISNLSTTKDIINKLGSTDFSTSFSVQDSNSEDILRVVGIGRMMVGGGLFPIAQFQIDGNLNTEITGDIDIEIGSPILSGVGTAFQDEMEVGNSIKINNEVFTVIAIPDQQILTIDGVSSATLFGLTGYRDSDFVSIHNGDGKLVFKIDEDSRVSVGATTSHESALFDINSTTRGFLKPRMTIFERTLIQAPATGLEIFNLTLNEPEFYNGSSWVTSAGAETLAQTLSNGNTTSGTNISVTTGDAIAFVDGAQIRLGTDDDLVLEHNGLASSILNSNGLFIIRNLSSDDLKLKVDGVNSNIDIQLGASTSGVSFNVQPDVGPNLFSVLGNGQVEIGNAIFSPSDVLTGLEQIIMGDGKLISLGTPSNPEMNIGFDVGFGGFIQVNSGPLALIGANTSDGVELQVLGNNPIFNTLGTTTTSSYFQIRDSSLSPLLTVLGDGNVALTGNLDVNSIITSGGTISDDLSIALGSGSVSGGSLDVTAGRGTGIGGVPGSIFIQAGDADNAAGATTTVKGGNGGTASFDQYGGDLILAGGNQGAADRGGNVILQPDMTFGRWVGIGTNDPGAPFHLKNGSSGANATSFANVIYERSTVNLIQLLAPETSESGFIFGRPSNSFAAGIHFNGGFMPDGLDFRTNSLSRMVIALDGNVRFGSGGLGVPDPETQLEIRSEGVGASRNLMVSEYSSGGTGPRAIFKKARGTASIPLSVTSGDVLMDLDARGYDGVSALNGDARIIAIANQDFSVTGHGTYLAFETTPDDAIVSVERMKITDDGNVIIGPSTSSNSILELNSTTKAFRLPLWTTLEEADNTFGYGVADKGKAWFNTTTDAFNGWDGTKIVKLG